MSLRQIELVLCWFVQECKNEGTPKSGKRQGETRFPAGQKGRINATASLAELAKVAEETSEPKPILQDVLLFFADLARFARNQNRFAFPAFSAENGFCSFAYCPIEKGLRSSALLHDRISATFSPSPAHRCRTARQRDSRPRWHRPGRGSRRRPGGTRRCRICRDSGPGRAFP